jgi:hypothetical protein
MTRSGIDHNGKHRVKSDSGMSVRMAYVAHLVLEDPIAAAAASILAANLGTAVQEITTGITHPDYPRCLRIVGNVAGIAGNVVITGKNYSGLTITETLALNGTTVVNGAKAFRAVTKVVLPAQSHVPAKQQESITVTAGCTQDGYLKITVTAAGMPNSPKAVWVAVTTDDNTVNEVATKIRAALAADVDVSGFFTIGGTDATVTITAKAYAANDATMEIAMDDAPACGVTISASADTTGGTLGVAQVETIAVTGGASGAGDLTFRVTAAVLGDDSPLDVTVAISADDNETSEAALKIREALAADAIVSEHFTVGGTGANIILTAKVKAANDGTLAMALQAAGTTGVTVGASGNTTAGVAPVCQKETISATHKADSKGVIVIAVTAAGMTNSPKSVNVWVDENDSTVNLVAAKIRAALAADDDVGAFFTVSGSNAEINITAKTDAANDATMAMALTDAPTTAVTVGASTNTTAGVPLDIVSVGVNDILGLPYKLKHNTILETFLNNVKEAVAPTVTLSSTDIESNTIDLASALDGNQVDIYLLV